MSSSSDDSSSSEDERGLEEEKQTIVQNASREEESSSEEDSESEEEQRGGGLRPFSSGSLEKSKENADDSSSESDDQSEDEEEKEGDIEGEQEIDPEDISNIESDAIFRLIQEQFANPNGEEVDVYEGGYMDDEINVSNDDSFDFGEENAVQETESKKRSNELLYLDPEEQDPFLIGKSNRPWKKPSIGKVEPSDILERVKQFLPQFEAANEDLQSQVDAGVSFDIEQLQNDDQPYIEMNLALGVLDEDSEVKSPPDGKASQPSENKKLIEML